MRRGRFNLKMRILVIGGTGFIGGRLVNHLLKSDHCVKIAVRNSIGPADQFPKAMIEKIVWDDDRSLECICDGVDMIVHSASMNAQDSAINPVAALNFNGIATARLVNAASRVGVKRFLYFSTAHVYGRPLIGNITEKMTPNNKHPYATSHLAGEHAVLMANNLGRIKGVVLRLSNTFGVPTDKNKNCWMLFVNDLCRQAIQTGNLVIQSNRFQQRDFIGLNQVCSTVGQLIDEEELFENAGILNLGTGISRSLISMAQLVQMRCIDILGFKPQIHWQEKGCDSKLPLSYRVEKMASLGIKCGDSRNIEELDNLINFCKSSFSVGEKVVP